MNKISDTVRERIKEEFDRHLRWHLLSEKSYQKEVTISTVYENLTQSVTIRFDKEERNNAEIH